MTLSITRFSLFSCCWWQNLSASLPLLSQQHFGLLERPALMLLSGQSWPYSVVRPWSLLIRKSPIARRNLRAISGSSQRSQRFLTQNSSRSSASCGLSWKVQKIVFEHSTCMLSLFSYASGSRTSEGLDDVRIGWHELALDPADSYQSHLDWEIVHLPEECSKVK